MRYIFPVKTYLTITQPFKGVSVHSGVDFGWNSAVSGANHQFIIAAEAGTVVKAVDGYGNTWGKLPKTYGNYVIIDHGDNEYTVYGHLEKNSVCVKRGQKVAKGDPVGRMGKSGYSRGQHLHFEFRKGANLHSNAVNPMPYLRIEDRSLIVSPNTMLPKEIKYRVVTVPVERNPKVDQISVTGKYVNARADHSTTSESYGYIVPGVYNVEGTFKDGKYLWYDCGDFWCAQVSGVEFLSHEMLYDVTLHKVKDVDVASVESVADKLNVKVTKTLL